MGKDDVTLIYTDLLKESISHHLFFFGYSAGQAKEQIDGLNQLQMNKLFGGRNYLIKETVIVPLKRQPAEK